LVAAENSFGPKAGLGTFGLFAGFHVAAVACAVAALTAGAVAFVLVGRDA